MPFIRYSRDARGNENTYVMHAYRSAQGGQRTKVLYLFRSPSNIKGVGRKPLDGEVIEALEHTHPDLTFDWTALLRDGIRQDSRERQGRAVRRGPVHKPPTRPSPRAASSQQPAGEDESLLSRVLGRTEADRLRRAYSDVCQRIARRARTPEERDRLTQQAGRLNPDGWEDEAAASAGAQSVEAEWDALTAELPARRRGRRGGRRREPGPSQPTDIMAKGKEAHEEPTEKHVAEPARPAAGGGDDGGVSPGPDGDEPGPAVDVSGDS